MKSARNSETKYLNVFNSFLKKELETEFNVSMFVEVNLSAFEELRKKIQSPVKLSYTALVAKAIATALKEHPCCHRRVVKKWFGLGLRFESFDDCDIAIAVEKSDLHNVAYLEIVRKVENKGLQTLTEEIRSFLTRESSPSEENAQWAAMDKLVQRFPVWIALRLLSLPFFFPKLWRRYRGSSVLISSPGKYGADIISATWSSPIGFSYGYVKKRPFVVDGQLVAVMTVHLTMSFDRRVIGGGPAGRFLNRVRELMESPENLL